MKVENNNKLFRTVIVAGAFLFIGVVSAIFLPGILRDYKANVQRDSILYIRPGASFEAIRDSIAPCLKNVNSFLKTARHSNLENSFMPGRYKLEAGMKNKDIVRMIQRGWQTPMMLTLSGNIRNKERLASILGRRLAADSADFAGYFNDAAVWKKYGLKEETFISIFIPNSYEVYWTITPEQFMERMKKENDAFWTPERRKKAEELGLSREEVSTLASIVCEESNYKPEQPAIAGVYINRLKKGMKLDADPTVKFAWKDPSIKRILFRHLEIDSPYNTYKNTGLPPGPITIPGVNCLDAVLNYGKHTYLYFCADASLNGTHRFAGTLAEHNRNARAYQAAISKPGVK